MKRPEHQTLQWWLWEHIWISSTLIFAPRDWPHSELIFSPSADPHVVPEPLATRTSPGNICSKHLPFIGDSKWNHHFGLRFTQAPTVTIQPWCRRQVEGVWDHATSLTRLCTVCRKPHYLNRYIHNFILVLSKVLKPKWHQFSCRNLIFCKDWSRKESC